MRPRVVPPSTPHETCFPTPLLANRPNSCAPSANSCSSIICALFDSLAALCRARPLCFQQFADSFSKNAGVWGCASRSRLWTLGGSRRRLPVPETQPRDTPGWGLSKHCSWRLSPRKATLGSTLQGGVYKSL